MHLLLALVILVLIAAVLALVGAPLRRERSGAQAGIEQTGRPDGSIAALEAERASKYAEIRDVELDYRTGKLSQEDFRALDAELRAEALAILDRLERTRAEPGAQQPQ